MLLNIKSICYKMSHKPRILPIYTMLEVKINIKSDYAVVLCRHSVPEIVSCIRSLSAKETFFLRWMPFSFMVTRVHLPWGSRQEVNLIFSHLYTNLRGIFTRKLKSSSIHLSEPQSWYSTGYPLGLSWWLILGFVRPNSQTQNSSYHALKRAEILSFLVYSSQWPEIKYTVLFYEWISKQISRFQWPRGLRQSAAARLPRL